MKDNVRSAVVCFGEALVDFLARPPACADAPRHFVEYAGGAPANVAVAVARLEGRARFVGMLGKDMFGDMLASQLQAAGVDTAYVRRTDEAKTALAFVSLDAHGERSFSFYRPPAADLLFREAHFEASCFADAAVFHICSNSLTEAAIAATTLAGMRRARDAGALVSMDLNLRPSLWPQGVDPAPRLWDALLEADLVKLCHGELEFLAQSAGGMDAVLQRLGQGRAQCVLITEGAAPIRWFTRTQQGIAPTFPVQAVDTTAAGDAFVGGWLESLIDLGVDPGNLAAFLDQPARLAESLRQAAVCGALATTRHGAFAAMPTRAEVDHIVRAEP
ncbi:MAG TPA: carbohydrate kinase [Lysobacter sp.]|nr:carbohydrate kinase [Lysobacter sp.]